MLFFLGLPLCGWVLCVFRGVTLPLPSTDGDDDPWLFGKWRWVGGERRSGKVDTFSRATSWQGEDDDDEAGNSLAPPLPPFPPLYTHFSSTSITQLPPFVTFVPKSAFSSSVITCRFGGGSSSSSASSVTPRTKNSVYERPSTYKPSSSSTSTAYAPGAKYRSSTLERSSNVTRQECRVNALN